jgi:hypothetical protein
VILAIARVERQLKDADDLVRDALESMGPPHNVPFASLDPALVALLAGVNVTDEAGMRALRPILQSISQWIGHSVPVTCTTTGCPAGRIGYANAGVVAGGAAGLTVTLGAQPSASVPVTYLCDPFFTLGAADQTRAIHVLFMLSHQTHISGSGYVPARSLAYADFAAGAGALRTPAPHAGTAPHEAAGRAALTDPNVPHPVVP